MTETTKSESLALISPLKLRLINPSVKLTCIFSLLCPKPNSWSHMCSFDPVPHLLGPSMSHHQSTKLLSTQPVSHAWFYPFSHLPSSKPTKPIDLSPKHIPNVSTSLHLHPPSAWPKSRSPLAWTIAVTHPPASTLALLQFILNTAVRELINTKSGYMTPLPKTLQRASIVLKIQNKK